MTTLLITVGYFAACVLLGIAVMTYPLDKKGGTA